MGTDNLDLAELRREYRHVPEIVALLDRIEALEAERDEAERRGEAWVTQAGQQEARADRAEARLARLTEDSMAERLAEIPLWWKKRMDDGYVSTGARTEREVAADALATIRAVAADEQEAGQPKNFSRTTRPDQLSRRRTP